MPLVGNLPHQQAAERIPNPNPNPNPGPSPGRLALGPRPNPNPEQAAELLTPKRRLSRFLDFATSRRVTRQLPVAQDSVFRVRAQYIKCSSRQRRSFGVLHVS